MTTRRISTAVPADTTGMMRLRTATNMIVNPRCGAASIASWAKSVGASGLDMTIAAATGTGPGGVTTYLRATITDAPEATGANIVCGGGAGGVTNPIDAGDIGKEFIAGVWVRSSRAVRLRSAIAFYNGASNLGSTYGSPITVPAAAWTLLPAPKKVAPATTTAVNLYVNTQDLLLQVGDTIDAAVDCYRTDDIATLDPIYRDGSFAKWAWAGTPHSSRSTGIIGIA